MFISKVADGTVILICIEAEEFSSAALL